MVYLRHCMLVMPLLFGFMLAAGQQTGSLFTTQPWNIQGSVLVLDVGSIAYQYASTLHPPLSQRRCADACARTAGCNAWVYCNSTTGCGSGCQAYAKDNPPLPVYKDSLGYEGTNPDWQKYGVFTAAGPWGFTGKCQADCDVYSVEHPESCKPTDKWPYGVCTLSSTDSLSDPVWWSKDASEGWVSGYAKMPNSCSGIPLRTCRRCLNSKSPINCLKCASNPIFKLGLLEALMSPADTLSKADACADCYNSTRPALCVGCLTSNAPCAECALQNTAPAPTAHGWPLVDVGSCVNCTMYHGEVFKSACMSCSYMEAGSKEQSPCFSCLDSMIPLACKPENDQQDCWNPTYGGDPGCSTCTTSAHNPNVCYDCLHASPFSPYCATCASQFNDTRQERCYQCIADRKHSGDGCIGCLHYDEPAEQDQCLACLKDPSLSDSGKNYCSACMGWCNTKESRARCMQCLANTPNDASQDQWYKCSCDPDAHSHYGLAHGVAGADTDW